MENLLAGVVAGAASTAVLQPIDVVKVRYQVFTGTARSYSSVLSAVRTIVSTEGVGALYKGLSPAMLGSAMSWGLYMHFYEHAKAALLAGRASETRLSSLEHMGAAMSAGGAVALITTPIWMIKTRLQLQVEGVEVGEGKRQYRGLLGACLRFDGVSGATLHTCAVRRCCKMHRKGGRPLGIVSWSCSSLAADVAWSHSGMH